MFLIQLSHSTSHLTLISMIGHLICKKDYPYWKNLLKLNIRNHFSDDLIVL